MEEPGAGTGPAWGRVLALHVGPWAPGPGGSSPTSRPWSPCLLGLQSTNLSSEVPINPARMEVRELYNI